MISGRDIHIDKGAKEGDATIVSVMLVGDKRAELMFAGFQELRKLGATSISASVGKLYKTKAVKFGLVMKGVLNVKG